MALSTNDDKFLWAFAVDASRPVRAAKTRSKRAAQPKYKLYRYTVTACSPQLRNRGVRVGMRYDEAKRLAPAMRVIVCNR